MKTEKSQKSFGNPFLIGLLFILLLSLAAASVAYSQDAVQATDSTEYTAYTGKIVDEETKKPIVFANVILKGTNMGTVTNADGEFIIKAPASWNVEEVEVTHLGYQTKTVKLADLSGRNAEVSLAMSAVPIEGITISYGNPEELIRKAVQKIPENYSRDPVMLKAFYRETIRKNRTYVGVAEAVLDIYKVDYKSLTAMDRTRVYKGRKGQDYKKMDTLVVKLQGGPFISLMLDVAKHPGEILSPDYLGLYNFTYGGLTTLQDRQAMIVYFKPKSFIEDPLYTGKIFLDEENLAIIGVDFNLDEKRLGNAAEMFVQRKPASLKVDIESANYLTKYRIDNGTWYLSYIRSELDFSAKWKKKLFSSKYALMSELAVTDVDRENVTRFRYSESARYSDVLAEQVSQFQDPDFWGHDNIIKPDESIEEAIEKLSRRIQRGL